MQENMWWEPLQYSLNQLDLFDMRGCHFVMLPPLRGDNPSWEQQHSRATITQNKHLIAVHSFPFIVLNKDDDSSSQAKLMSLSRENTVLPKCQPIRSKENFNYNLWLRCIIGNHPKTKRLLLAKCAATETPLYNMHQVQETEGGKKKVLKKLQLPMENNKLHAINCIWQVHTVTLQT